MAPQPPTAPWAFQTEALSAGYNGQQALDGVSFAVEQGRLLGVVGPNGAGKSTLFKVAMGLLKPWAGDIAVMGQRIPEGRRWLGYTPQVELVDWQFPVSVFDVVLMGRYGRLGLLRRPSGADRDAAWRALEQMQLHTSAKRQISELSGGQQRRMLIARALAQEPQVLLLDEPLVNLDATTQHELLEIFDALRAQGKTVLVATHDLSCVFARFDLALCLNKRVVAYGPSHQVLTEENLNATFESHLLFLNLGGKLYASHTQ